MISTSQGTDVNKSLNYYCNLEELFEGTLGGGGHINPVHLDLKEVAVPKYHKPFQVAKTHEDILKKELER